MSISISNYPAHLQDGFKPNRECLKSQGRKRAVWLFGCCECLWAELCKAVF